MSQQTKVVRSPVLQPGEGNNRTRLQGSLERKAHICKKYIKVTLVQTVAFVLLFFFFFLCYEKPGRLIFPPPTSRLQTAGFVLSWCHLQPPIPRASLSRTEVSPSRHTCCCCIANTGPLSPVLCVTVRSTFLVNKLLLFHCRHLFFLLQKKTKQPPKTPNHQTPATASLQLQGGYSSLVASEKFDVSGRRCCDTLNLLCLVLS